APKVCSTVVSAVQPRLLVVVVHRADTHTPHARFLSLVASSALDPSAASSSSSGGPDAPSALRLMALAPHVANLSSHKLRRPVSWSLPVAPFRPPPATPPCERKECMRGFSIQGALRRFKSKHGNGLTRDFSGLWSRMMELRRNSSGSGA
ncbi:hypothetical protein Agub_g2720, partial [Astrephomene gubernaculifera]